MPGVVFPAADRPSPGSSEVDLEPNFSGIPPQERLVEGLRRRTRPVRGGQQILGPVVTAQKSTGAPTQSSTLTVFESAPPPLSIQLHFGTLGVLLEDAADPDVGYGLTALHALDPAKGDAAFVRIGDAVYQPLKKYDGFLSGFKRIGWVIAICPELDVALIGLKPGLRWHRHIEAEDSARVTRLVPTQGSRRPALKNQVVADAPSAGTGELWRWVNPDAPVRVSLPQSGPPCWKTGHRTGRTTGKLYWFSVRLSNSAFHQIPAPGAGSPTSPRTWSLMDSFYASIRTAGSTDPDLMLALGDDRFNPPVYLCVPDAGTAATADLVSFQQKGDSGSALLAEDDGVLGILCQAWEDHSGTSGWIGGLAVPIDLVVSALRDQFDHEFGPASGADWPEPVVPTNVGAADRLVPRNPRPRWYQLVDANPTHSLRNT